MHGVDGTQLYTSVREKFDLVVFPFPRASLYHGPHENDVDKETNRILIRKFFSSVRSQLSRCSITSATLQKYPQHASHLNRFLRSWFLHTTQYLRSSNVTSRADPLHFGFNKYPTGFFVRPRPSSCDSSERIALYYFYLLGPTETPSLQLECSFSQTARNLYHGIRLANSRIRMQIVI